MGEGRKTGSLPESEFCPHNFGELFKFVDGKFVEDSKGFYLSSCGCLLGIEAMLEKMLRVPIKCEVCGTPAVFTHKEPYIPY